jgi:hypothetical protein
MTDDTNSLMYATLALIPWHKMIYLEWLQIIRKIRKRTIVFYEHLEQLSDWQFLNNNQASRS